MYECPKNVVYSFEDFELKYNITAINSFHLIFIFMAVGTDIMLVIKYNNLQ